MTFSDDVAVKASTIDSSDILVSGPHGYSQTATLVSASRSTDGTPISATYQIGAPGGAWDSADYGSYAISLRQAQVADVAGNFEPAGVLASLNVSGSSMARVSGNIFLDQNGDGRAEAGDSDLKGIAVYIDLNHNGVADAGEPQTLTDGAGNYQLTISAGMYRVREVLPAGYGVSSPGRGFYDITLGAAQNLSRKDFADTQHPLPASPPLSGGVAMSSWGLGGMSVEDDVVTKVEERLRGLLRVTSFSRGA